MAETSKLSERLLRASLFVNFLTCLVCLVSILAYRNLSARIATLERAALSGPNTQLHTRLRLRPQRQASTTSPDEASLAFPSRLEVSATGDAGALESVRYDVGLPIQHEESGAPILHRNVFLRHSDPAAIAP